MTRGDAERRGESPSICYTIANDGGYLPSDVDGSTLPPAGSHGVS